MLKETLKDRFLILYNVLTSRAFYHVAFWTGLFFLLFLIDRPSKDISLFSAVELLQIGCFMLVVYSNINYLVPKYLSQNKVLTYFIYLLCVTLIVTLLRVTIQYWLLNNQQELQHKLVYEDQIFIYLLHFFIGIASTAFVISSRWIKTEREKREIKSQQVESELKFLKSQINPHFLFNILNSLYALTIKKSDQAPELVIKLSEMMRYMLYECNEKIVPLDKEINYLKNYLDLEKIRIGSKMDIKIEIEGDPSDKFISPLIFVNFVENSFKHGGKAYTDGQGFVYLHIVITENEIDFQLKNSKAVMNQNSPDKLRIGGIGIKNVKERLALLYPKSHMLLLKEEPDNYTVNLKISLNQ